MFVQKIKVKENSTVVADKELGPKAIQSKVLYL